MFSIVPVYSSDPTLLYTATAYRILSPCAALSIDYLHLRVVGRIPAESQLHGLDVNEESIKLWRSLSVLLIGRPANANDVLRYPNTSVSV